MPSADGAEAASLRHLPAAALLAATGGMLDTVAYLLHGHVFANAMTGNVVLLGIAAATADLHQIVPHAAPILAYLAGVLLASAFRAAPLHRLTLAALGIEMAALAVIGALPSSLPHTVFVGTVALVSAFQVTCFRRVESFKYNSTFVTGNLRDVIEGLYQSMTHPDPAQRFRGRQKARDLGVICLSFLAGATAGAFLAPRFPAHAVWFAEPTLAIVFLLTLRNAVDRPA